MLHLDKDEGIWGDLAYLYIFMNCRSDSSSDSERETSNHSRRQKETDKHKKVVG